MGYFYATQLWRQIENIKKIRLIYHLYHGSSDQRGTPYGSLDYYFQLAKR